MKQGTKAHTQQPAHKHAPAQQRPKDMWYVLGWLLLPVALACLAIYKWRSWRNNMGYRTVRYER